MKNEKLSLKYRVLRRLVKAANIKKRRTGMSTEALLENRRKQNAKNRIPALSDRAFTIDRTSTPPRRTTATWRTTIRSRAQGRARSERWEINETGL